MANRQIVCVSTTYMCISLTPSFTLFLSCGGLSLINCNPTALSPLTSLHVHAPSQIVMQISCSSSASKLLKEARDNGELDHCCVGYYLKCGAYHDHAGVYCVLVDELLVLTMYLS